MDAKSDFVVRIKDHLKLFYPTEAHFTQLVALFVEYDRLHGMVQEMSASQRFKDMAKKSARRYFEDQLIELGCAPDDLDADDGPDPPRSVPPSDH